MDISVIICTKDRTNDLAKFLDSLSNQTRMPDELIIVNASQKEKTRHMLKQKSNQLPFDIIYKRTPSGLTRQRNIGISLIQGIIERLLEPLVC